ncbi:glycine betaine ABC transporter substrate-binding protein [Gemmatimonas groenlandica]|uniref:ABC transporter permease subunit n=1 Tax=Gemmatimonas groenlandica TaxID=2732249 RepID=A0A6M4IKN3_9BACT|nr:glycine betaine ABC transporter substrate-binding protein [Gemmatimonas groenlandica]QJR35200.1 ABC transporter permease subunit [Gemmatimonas groenlandica]
MTSLHRRWARVGSLVTTVLAVMNAALNPAEAQRVAASALSPSAAQRGRAVVIASKPFGESYVLAEMFAQLLERRGIAVDRRLGLGATEVAFGALQRDAIDVYPEYTGTGLLAILHDSLTDAMRRDPRLTFAHVSAAFDARYGVRWLPPLGFQNGYAIAVRRETAERFGLRTLSDLKAHPGEFTGGFTADFLGRPDGAPGLASAYGLRWRAVRPLAPAVKYAALVSGDVDIIDGYSTDGLLSKYDLVTLEDDLHFFPPYEAAAIVGPGLVRDRPDAVAELARLSGRLTERLMRDANRRVEVEQTEVRVVAGELLTAIGLGTLQPTTSASVDRASFAAYLWSQRSTIAALTARHLALVAMALAAAILVAVPLGLALERAPRAAERVLGALGVIQTVPSIALLAFMIPVLGIGTAPALVALWLYALFPIARSTYTGVRTADADAVAACEAMGASPLQRLWWVRVPLAMPTIFIGIRTSAVITVGAATLAAFIGAGGLGDPIVAGLALADTRMVLSGALPAAVLALAVDRVLALLEYAATPGYLRRATR